MSEDTPPSQPHHTKDVVLGFFLCISCHLLQLLYLPSGILIGITQFIYVIPMLILFRRRKGVIQGLLIAAALTFLLNAACFGLFISQF